MGRLSTLLESEDEIICRLVCLSINNIVQNGLSYSLLDNVLGVKEQVMPEFLQVVPKVVPRLLSILEFATEEVLIIIMSTFGHLASDGMLTLFFT